MLENCVLVLTVIAFLGLIFAVITYCISKVEVKETQINEPVKLVKNSELPIMRGFCVCSSIEIRKVYDYEKREYTGEFEECAFFRYYAVPTVLSSDFRTEAFVSYPVGACPWHIGDLLEVKGSYFENLVKSSNDVIIERYTTQEKVTALSDAWYDENVLRATEAKND